MSGSDQMLLEHWVMRRDAEAFRELAARYSGLVFATCLRVLGNAASAEDAAQECFETLARADSAPGGYLGAWLHRVATNRALNHLKAERRRRQREQHYAAKQSSVMEVPPDDLYAHVDKAIEALPEKLRAPLVAHFLEGQSHAAIAETLGTSRQTVTYRIRQGIEKTRRSLARRGVSIAPGALAAAMAAARAEAAAVPLALTATLGKLAVAGPASGPGAGLILGAKTVGGLIMSTKKIAAIVVALLVVVGGAYVVPRTLQDSAAPGIETAEQTRMPLGAEAGLRADGPGAALAEAGTQMGPGTDPSVGISQAESTEENEEAAPEETEVPAAAEDAEPDRDANSISGRILSTRNEGLEGAEVQLIQRLADGGGPRASTTSGADGAYAFDGVRKARTYVVRAAYEGYSTKDSGAIIVRGDKAVTNVDIYLGAGFAVHGHVLDSKGKGVEDLLVQLLEGGGRAYNPIPNLEAVSGYGGAFVIANVGPGQYTPLVRTARMNRADMSHVTGASFTMAADADIYDVDIVIGDQVEGFISGRVTGHQGEPIFWVELVAFSGNLSGVAKSDEDGYYAIEGLGGAKTVSMEVKGFASGYGRTKRQGVPINSENVDFVLQKAGAVSGRVVDAVTEEPLTEFAVQWNEYWPWEAFQSEAGEFTLTQVEQEEVALRAQAIGYAMGKSELLTIPPGETLEDVTIRLTRGNELAGIVVDSATGQPLEGARLKAFEGYRLRSEALRGSAWGPQDPITDAQGRFRIGGLAPETAVNIVAWHEGYAPSVVLDLSTESGDELVFLLGPGSTVIGTVHRGSDPVSGANIVFFRTDFRPDPTDPFSFHAFCSTRQTGEFERANLPPGRYIVACYLDNEPAWQERREFTDGEIYELPIQLEDTGSIVGQVTGFEAGARIEIILMSATWLDEPYSVENCDGDGGFAFDVLPAGSYTIHVSGFPESGQDVTVAPGEEAAVVLELPVGPET